MMISANKIRYRSARCGALAALFLSWGMIASGEAQETGDVAKGQKVAEQICAECHATKRDESVSPHFNVASFRRIANTPGMTAQALFIWMTSSHPTMPNFILEEKDRRDVVAYIESLRDK